MTASKERCERCDWIMEINSVTLRDYCYNTICSEYVRLEAIARQPIKGTINNTGGQCPKCGIQLDPDVTYTCGAMNEFCPVLDQVVGPEPDYRRLLVRYMARVIDCEGVAFLEGACSVTPNLADEELTLLTQIETEARKEWNL